MCRLLLLLFIVVLLQACAGTSTTVPKDVSEQAVSKVDIALPSAANTDSDFYSSHYLASDAEPWWQGFNDPVLAELIAITIENSTDIGLAVARLDEAVANARSSRAAGLPTLDFDVQAGVSSTDLESGGLQSNPARVNTLSADFSLAWQADLFGQLRNATAAEKARMQSQEARVRDTQRVIVSRVVQTYYQLVSTRERLALTQISVSRRAENKQRIDQLLERGYSTYLDKTRADSQLYESNAAFAQLELEEVTLLNQIGVLSGIGVAAIRGVLEKTGQLAEPPADIPLPSINLLIQHRPDLRALERDLVASAYNVNSAIASLYPTLGLTVSLGKGDDNRLPGSFPALDVITGGVLTRLATPILGRGRLLAAIDVNSARLKQAHYSFEQAALNAISDIDTAIVSMDKNRTIYQQRELAAESASTAADLSKELFKSGELDYTSVILAEQTRVTAESSAVTAKLGLLTAYINYMSAVAPAW